LARIAPFRAIRYNSEAIDGAFAQTICPPYDVISPAEQDELYGRHPENFVRVVLNRAQEGDDLKVDPYQRAAANVFDWLETGILEQDDEPSLYLYEQEFTSPGDGKRYKRKSLLCALGLAPYEAGVVLPHEETRAKAREDRLRHMRIMHANPEPIYCLYLDEDRHIAMLLSGAEKELVFEAEIGGDIHRLIRLADPELYASIAHAFEEKRIWIADGHHRYETALAYRDEMRAKEDVLSPEYDSILVALSAFDDPGLVVLPTHRLVKGRSEATLAGLPAKAAEHFDVEHTTLAELPTAMKKRSPGEVRMGVMTPFGAYVLTLKSADAMKQATPERSEAWRSLDVTVLQTLVLDQCLGIPAAELATTPDIGYTRSYAEAIEEVESGQWQLAFLLNDPSSDEVLGVTNAGEKMPPKSTFYYPKLWSGVVMRRL
jgi:uncharacterized protein (DUF1015 family)